MLKRLAFLALLVPILALAQGGEPAGKLTSEAIIKRTLEARLGGGKVDAVAKTPYLGLYEVRLPGNEIIYVDEKMTYIFSGSIHDGKSMQNLTEKRLRELSSIKWDDLPLETAVKTVRGNGKRVLAVFSDPNCPYCKRFEKDLVRIDNITVYTFLYPILSQDSNDKSRAVWCSADKSKAWIDLMLNGTLPATARCETPIEKNLELGRKIRVNGTPTLFFANGERLASAIPAEQIEKMLAENGK
jgi:thiol:disulfide interchange protein DsbC